MSNKIRKTHRTKDRPGGRPSSPDRRGAELKSPRTWSAWLLAAALLFATLAAYYPAWHGNMLWDDDRHITRTDLRSVEGLYRIWFQLGATQQYYPVTHSAFWLQHKIWGDATLGYHLVNIILHVLAALLAAVILKRLGVPWAWLAALIFALHPVQVESAAWITELKNTLSGVFYLASALVYLRYDRDRQRGSYGLALALFFLALLTKTVTATLPAALLVAFWWQRGKLDWRRDVRPLAPWFALGLAAGLFTAWVEHAYVGAQGAAYQLSFVDRFLVAGRAVWFYLGKLLWPANLIFVYPRWQVSQGVWWQYLFPLSLAALIAVLWMMRKRSRAPLAAMLFFCGTLFPALGFVNVFPFRYSFVADHFQYLACISIIALFAAAAAGAARRWRVPARPAAVCIALALGIGLALPTWRQSRQYADAATLYQTTIRRNPSCWMAYNNLGNVLHGRERFEEAVCQYREALRLKPDYAEAHNNLGNALQGLVRLEEAVSQYEQALRLAPDLAGVHYNLGNALQGMGRVREAEAQYREALKEDPASARTHGNLGSALDKMGRFEEAVTHLQEALRMDPSYLTARINLGKALQRMGRLDEAAAQYREALRLNPGSAEARSALGQAYQGMGRFDQARAEAAEALRLRPGSAEALNNLANALLGEGRIEEALAQYREALRIQPDFALTYFNLGSALQGMGRLEEAAARYREVLKLKPDLAAAHHNLALILQNQGRYAEAAAHYREEIRTGGNAAEAYNNLGVCLAAQGRIGEAASQFKEALRLQPNHAEAQANLARALAILKK